ncbi:response regulator transcription factor [bacterium]|nr:response regulator transcription factor [bacterium]MBP9809979.1 response regulator transcription factor [bacterium]
MTNVLFLLNNSQLIEELYSVFVQYGDMNIVGCTSDSNCATQYLAKEHIDIVVVDTTLAFLDSRENIQQFLEGASQTPIKWIAMTKTIATLLPPSLTARDGSMAYVNPTASAVELFQVLSLVGKGYFVCKMEKDTDTSFGQLAESDEKFMPQLSQREMQILCLLAQGLPNREIATAIGLTEGTVKNHTSSIFNRLGLKGRTQAALWARTHFSTVVL